MVRQLHVANAAGRDATVAFTGLQPEAPPRLGLPGHDVAFARFLAAAEDGLHDALVAAHGEDYAQALIDGDPEVDLEAVGQRLGRTDRVYLSGAGEVLYAPPTVVEIVTGPDGEERERRAPVDTEANIQAVAPVRWVGRTLPRREVVRRFVFSRTVQIRHVDGLTYDYLFEMARTLAEADAMVRLAAGERGREPLRFSTNGSPYQGFLEGRVDGDRYLLLLHLSQMELKRPAPQGSGS